jgi:nucleotide-binding universal stress UspA family protein
MNFPVPSTARRIVVGVDGSPCSKAALSWAITEARLTGASIEAVTSWQNPVMYGSSFAWAPMVYDTSLSSIMTKVLLDTITEVTTDAEQSVEISPRVVEGHPAQVLLDAARGAQMLVVGSRGHSTLAGIVLGSVSQHCVQHAPCPVVVIPQVAVPTSKPIPTTAAAHR